MPDVDGHPVILEPRGPVGSGTFQVVHVPCGHPIGRIAHRTDGRPGVSWWRVAVPPQSIRAPGCPTRELRANAVTLLVRSHRCPRT